MTKEGDRIFFNFARVPEQLALLEGFHQGRNDLPKAHGRTALKVVPNEQVETRAKETGVKQGLPMLVRIRVGNTQYPQKARLKEVLRMGPKKKKKNGSFMRMWAGLRKTSKRLVRKPVVL